MNIYGSIFNFDIIYYIELITIENRHSNSIRNIYNEDLDNDHRKFIVNQTVGKCGKKSNKIIKSCIFNNINDANNYINENNEKISNKYEIDDSVIVNIYRNRLLENGFILIREMILDMQRMKLLKLHIDFEKISLY